MASGGLKRHEKRFGDKVVNGQVARREKGEEEGAI